MSDPAPSAPQNGVVIPKYRFFLFCGVILPFATIVAEWLFQPCASSFFAVMPGLGHALLLLSVPAANLALYLCIRGKVLAPLKWLVLANGFTFLTLVFYLLVTWHIGLLSFVVVPFTVLLPIGFPLCLMGATPLIAFGAWFSALWKLNDRNLTGMLKHWLAGAAAALICVTIIEAPYIATIHAVDKAATKDPVTMADAVQTIRRFGNPEVLLSLCYRTTGSLLQQSPGSALLGGGWKLITDASRMPRSADPESARDLYYRVTGQPFNEMPPPSRRTLGDFQATSDFDEWTWDRERGGDAVGARMKGLSLDQSRIDWQIEPAARLAYGEWTLVFKNQQSTTQEARCQIRLPVGGVVSRLTLWVNGEPQEAAFDSKSKVTAAYKQVVTVERRDPVLVNQIGPDRVMMQCFPVPAAGGTMKVRIGITAPLRDHNHSDLTNPTIVERNFSFPSHLTHSVWVQSAGPLEPNLHRDRVKTHEGGNSWQQDLTASELRSLRVRATLPKPEVVWTEDPFAEAPDKFLQRTPASRSLGKLTDVTFVIDTSVSLASHQHAIRKALSSMPASVKWHIVLPTDGPDCVKTDERGLEQAFRDTGFEGGRDNTSALLEAMRSSPADAKASAIVWLHGPQPLSFAQTEKILQQIERAPMTSPIYPLELEPGPNRLMEVFYRHHSLRSTPTIASAEELQRTLNSIIGDERHEHFEYKHLPGPPAVGTKVSDQLARYWAFEQVMENSRSEETVSAAMAKLASRYQLVTPFSGAVVLEQKEQYDRAGLAQVDASTVPKISNVPEPGPALLAVLAFLLLGLRRRRA